LNFLTYLTHPTDITYLSAFPLTNSY